MLEEPQKKFNFKITDIRTAPSRSSVVVYANSVSKAVELFLQDYLKNDRLSVEITEQDYTSRKI